MFKYIKRCYGKKWHKIEISLKDHSYHFFALKNQFFHFFLGLKINFITNHIMTFTSFQLRYKFYFKNQYYIFKLFGVFVELSTI